MGGGINIASTAGVNVSGAAHFAQLGEQVLPFADTQVVDELAVAHLAQLRGGQRRLLLVDVVPEQQEGGKVGGVVDEAGVHRVGFRAHVGGAFAREMCIRDRYVTEIYSKGLFDLGASTTGRYAHLAAVRKVEYQNYKGAQYEPTYHPNVHNASLQVVSNAERDPIHYLMKYFPIYPDLETLKEVQQISMDIDRLESAIERCV